MRPVGNCFARPSSVRGYLRDFQNVFPFDTISQGKRRRIGTTKRWYASNLFLYSFFFTLLFAPSVQRRVISSGKSNFREKSYLGRSVAVFPLFFVTKLTFGVDAHRSRCSDHCAHVIPFNVNFHVARTQAIYVCFIFRIFSSFFSVSIGHNPSSFWLSNLAV